MNIDWFTFFAQIINFLLLVALLRWFLYGPVVRAMRKRQEEIKGRLREAAGQRQEAEEMARQYERRKEELEEERGEVMQEARQEAQQEGRLLLKKARQEVEEKRREWLRSYRREMEDLLFDLNRDAGRMSLEAARRTLSELADCDLEERMCAALAAQLNTIEEDQRAKIADSLHDSQGTAVVVRSAFQLSQDCRRRLREALGGSFGFQGEVVFSQASDLVCGLEMDVGGYALGWNVSDFLRDLETEFGQRLSEVHEGVAQGEA